MNSSTKIVVIPMKRLIICGIAALAVIILIIVLLLNINNSTGTASGNIYNSNVKTSSDNINDSNTSDTAKNNSIKNNSSDNISSNDKIQAANDVITYNPGVYTSSLSLNGNAVDVQVTVDKNNINSIEMVNLSDSVTTMYPLIENVFNDIADEVIKNGTIQNISYKADNKYTSTMILKAIGEALDKCTVR